jgi:hypothetical protein
MASLKERREAFDKQLGVHEVYNTAQEARENLSATLDDLLKLRTAKRTLEAEIANRETEVIQDTWAANSDAPVTKLEKIVKVEVQSDGYLRDLRKKLNEILTDIDAREFDKEILEVDIKIACARMNELQGYLTFVTQLMEKESGNA